MSAGRDPHRMRAEPPAADIAVVGAGAAGLTAAITAAAAPLSRRKGYRRRGRAAAPGPGKVLLFDARPRIGAKILMSGGARCNVTNARVTPSDFNGGPRHFVKHVLEAHTPLRTVEFFEKIGVKLVLEPGGRYFPETHSAKTVLEALMKEAARVGVRLVTGVRIEKIIPEAKGFRLEGASAFEGPYAARARRVVLATGGLSYPDTGSDGTGLRIAEGLGHRIVPTTAALTPFLTQDPDWKLLSGVSVRARLSVHDREGKRAETEDDFLFTHFGFSGPAVLDMSRHYARIAPERAPRVFANFIPDETETSLKNRFGDWRGRRPTSAATPLSRHASRRRGHRRRGQAVKAFFETELGLPSRFVDVFLKKAGFPGEKPATHCPGAELRKLFAALLKVPLEVSGVYGYRKAEATAGGVDLAEVAVQTMESKKVPGLYFAGEILDVDGRIGGFNFQWAWSSGAVAGRAAARKE